MPDLDDVFEDLQPPRGGLAGLRERLDEPRRVPWLPVLLVAATVVLVVAVWPRPSIEGTLPDPALAAALQGAEGASVVGLSTTTVVAAADTDEVAFYWVSTR